MKTENQPTIVKSSNTGAGAYIFRGLLLLGTGYLGYKAFKQGQENSAEKQLDTEAGQIALQLKNLFDSFVVSDSDFRRIYAQVNSSNSDEVAKIYRRLSGRNLSDDIASKISSKSVSNAQKVFKYNSKAGGLFRIDENERIVFTVGAGDMIGFAPNQKTPVKIYNIPFGIILRELNSPALIENLKKDPKTAPATVSIDAKPSARQFRVVKTMELPFASVQRASGWQKHLRFVKTRKVFAAVQILLGTNPKTKQPVYGWIDARDMVKIEKLNGVMGLAY